MTERLYFIAGNLCQRMQQSVGVPTLPIGSSNKFQEYAQLAQTNPGSIILGYMIGETPDPDVFSTLNAVELSWITKTTVTQCQKLDFLAGCQQHTIKGWHTLVI